MTREQAQHLLEAISTLGNAFEALHEAIGTIDDSTEQKTLRRMAAPMLVSSYDLVEHIVEQYPELDPAGSE